MVEHDRKLVYSVDEFAQLIGISRPLAYALTKKDGFPAIKVSQRRIVIPADALREWLNRASREA